MLNITITGDQELIAKLDAFPVKLQDALYRKVSELALKLEAKVKGKLSNDVLHVRSGDLRRSIHSDVTSGAHEVTGSVASSGDVKYAAIQEFGGTIKHPGGTAFYISQLLGGKAFFVGNLSSTAANLPRTKPHDIKIPERSFLRSSLAEMHDEIVTGLGDAVAEAAK